MIAIVNDPARWCGIDGRDYYVLNPDVMEAYTNPVPDRSSWLCESSSQLLNSDF